MFDGRIPAEVFGGSADDGAYVRESSSAVMPLGKCVAAACRAGDSASMMVSAAGKGLVHHALRSPGAVLAELLPRVFDVRTRSAARRIASVTLRLSDEQLDTVLAGLADAALGSDRKAAYGACLVAQDLCRASLVPTDPAAGLPVDDALGTGSMEAPKPAALGAKALRLLRPLLSAAAAGSQKQECGAERPTRLAIAAADGFITAVVAAAADETGVEGLWGQLTSVEQLLALAERWYSGLPQKPCVSACAAALKGRLSCVSGLRHRSRAAEHNRRTEGLPTKPDTACDAVYRSTLCLLECLSTPPPDAPAARTAADVLRRRERAVGGAADVLHDAVAVAAAASPLLVPDAAVSDGGLQAVCEFITRRVLTGSRAEVVPGDRERSRAVGISVLSAAVAASDAGGDAVPGGAAAALSWLADSSAGKPEVELAAAVVRRHPRMLLPELLRAVQSSQPAAAARALAALRAALAGAGTSDEFGARIVSAVVAAGVTDDAAPALRHRAAEVLAELPARVVIAPLLRAICTESGAGGKAAKEALLCVVKSPQHLLSADAPLAVLRCCTAHKRSIGAAFPSSADTAAVPSPLSVAPSSMTPADVGAATLDGADPKEQVRRLTEVCVAATRHWAAGVRREDWAGMLGALWQPVLDMPSEELCVAFAAAAIRNAAAVCPPAVMFAPLLQPLRAAATAAPDPSRVFEALAPLLCLRSVPITHFTCGSEEADGELPVDDSPISSPQPGDNPATIRCLRGLLWRVATAAAKPESASALDEAALRAVRDVRRLAAELASQCAPSNRAAESAARRVSQELAAGNLTLAKVHLVFVCGMCAASLARPPAPGSVFVAGLRHSAHAALAALRAVTSGGVRDEGMLCGSVDAAALCLSSCARHSVSASVLEEAILRGFNGGTDPLPVPVCAEVLAAAAGYQRRSKAADGALADTYFPGLLQRAAAGDAVCCDALFNLATSTEGGPLRPHVAPLSELAIRSMLQGGRMQGEGTKLFAALLAKIDDLPQMLGPSGVRRAAEGLHAVRTAAGADPKVASLATELLSALTPILAAT